MLNILKETLHYQLLHVIFIIIIIICIVITFVTVITLDKYRSPHEFYLVPHATLEKVLHNVTLYM